MYIYIYIYTYYIHICIHIYLVHEQRVGVHAPTRFSSKQKPVTHRQQRLNHLARQRHWLQVKRVTPRPMEPDRRSLSEEQGLRLSSMLEGYLALPEIKGRPPKKETESTKSSPSRLWFWFSPKPTQKQTQQKPAHRGFHSGFPLNQPKRGCKKKTRRVEFSVFSRPV